MHLHNPTHTIACILCICHMHVRWVCIRGLLSFKGLTCCKEHKALNPVTISSGGWSFKGLGVCVQACKDR